MNASLGVILLWLLFAGSHMILSSPFLRSRLVGALGERPFLGLYSLLSFATFVPLVRFYTGHLHAGEPLGSMAFGSAVPSALVALGNTLAIVMMVAGVLRPSPAMVIAGPSEPRGVQHLTRHALFMGMAFWAVMHLLVNGYPSDIAFFGGFALFCILGSWHQDRRKLASGDPAFRRFYEATPFWPFSGPDTVRGLREFSKTALLIGVGIAIVARLAHPRL